MTQAIGSQKTAAATEAEASNRRPPSKAVAAKKSLDMPFWLVVAYFLVDYVRPQDIFSGLGSLHIPMVLSIVLGLTWLAKGNKDVLKEPIIILYGLFVLLAASTVIFAPNTFWTYQITRTLILYLLTATLPSVAFLGTREKMLKFFNIWIAMHVYLALVSMAHGGTGSGSFLRDNNDWALALNMVVPYAFFLRQSQHCSKLMQVLYVAALFVFLIAIVVTDSRGGFVGLVAVTAALLFFSRHRIRNLLLLALVAAILIPQIPTSYYERIETISAHTDNSSQDRLYSWRRGWEMFLDNPVLGVGAGNYPWTMYKYELRSPEYDPAARSHGGRSAHSVYVALLSELGLSGIFIYAAIVILVFQKLARLGRLGRFRKPAGEQLSDPELLARAMLVSLLAYFVCGTFLSVQYYPHLWYAIGFVICLERVANGESGKLTEPRAS